MDAAGVVEWKWTSGRGGREGGVGRGSGGSSEAGPGR
jgi:hypothetical protein